MYDINDKKSGRVIPSPIRLVALDLDGTLLDSEGRISDANLHAIRACIDNGVEVVASSGRAYNGLRTEELGNAGVRYGITVNGAAIYTIPEKHCLYEEAMTPEFGASLLREVMRRDVSFVAFIDGIGYTDAYQEQDIKRLPLSEATRRYIHSSRTFVDSTLELILEKQLPVQKITMNFYKDADGNYIDREELRQYFASIPDVTLVSGGFNNLEVTLSDVTKGNGLRKLCNILDIPVEAAMGVGDSGNDLSLLQAAGVGVAMANAEPEILKAADFITRSNDQDGVAYAIDRLVFGANV
jgi:Cof subfamily protein (haloacid dehalogenase superfamily)